MNALKQVQQGLLASLLVIGLALLIALGIDADRSVSSLAFYALDTVSADSGGVDADRHLWSCDGD